MVLVVNQKNVIVSLVDTTRRSEYNFTSYGSCFIVSFFK